MMNMNPRSTKRELYKKGGIDKGEKRTKRIKAVGTGCCYVDMTKQTTRVVFFSLFYPPSSPLGPSDESIISFLHLVLSVFFSSNILAADFLFCFTTIMREGLGRQDPEREDCPESKARQRNKDGNGLFFFCGMGPRKAGLRCSTISTDMRRAEQRRAEEGRGGIGYLSKCVVSSIGKDVTTLPPTPFLTYSILSQNKPENREKKKTHTKPPKTGGGSSLKSLSCSVPLPDPPCPKPSPESWKMQMMEGGSAVLVHGQGVVCGPRR